MATASPAPVVRAASVAARIRDLEQELAALRQQQLEALVIVIARCTGDSVFTAAEVWQHAQRVSAELRNALVEGGVTSPRYLGTLLKQWHRGPVAGWRLERIGRDGPGVVWAVCAADIQHAAGVSGRGAV